MWKKNSKQDFIGYRTRKFKKSNDKTFEGYILLGLIHRSHIFFFFGFIIFLINWMEEEYIYERALNNLTFILGYRIIT